MVELVVGLRLARLRYSVSALLVLALLGALPKLVVELEQRALVEALHHRVHPLLIMVLV